MKTLLAFFAMTTIATTAAEGWQPLFNGKDLEGWKANEKPETFTVSGGVLIVKGDRSHLFYVGKGEKPNFKNFELRLEILTKPNSNSGVYIHTDYQPDGWPGKGYEIQVNNTYAKDPKKTAGVYGIKDNLTAPVGDNEWFTMHITVKDKTITTKVNDKVISEWTEPEGWEPPKNFAGRKLGGGGTIAIQGHDPGSEVHYRKIEIKPLP
jgi:3-keto-disaccharide hydrolase